MEFNPTLGAECLPAVHGKALLIVHAGSMNGKTRADRAADYQVYLKGVRKKSDEYLNSGDIVIKASMRMDWIDNIPFKPEKNEVHIITLNGHGKVASQFVSGDVTYSQSEAGFVELLRKMNVKDIEVIGEFGKGCASEMKDLFKDYQFNAVMGKETFD